MQIANLDYVGSVEEIIGVDYGMFETLVLYCNWVKANMVGPHATMKRDDYGFTLVNFERLIPYSAQSFAFPLHVDQVFFVDNVNNRGWKVVLRKEPRSTRIASRKDDREEIQCLSIGKDADHRGLMPDSSFNMEATAMEPILEGGRVMSSNEVMQALNVEQAEPDFEDVYIQGIDLGEENEEDNDEMYN